MVDEPVRRVVASALVDGRPSNSRTIVTSVVSRIGTARISSGRMQRRDRRLRDLERRGDPARGEREAEHLAAGIAHEDSRAAARGEG